LSNVNNQTENGSSSSRLED